MNVRMLHVLLLFLGSVYAKRLKDRMYHSITASNFCFRRTNGTHQFGCTSDLGGNAGVLHLAQDRAGVEWILGDDAKTPPYVVAVNPQVFNRDNLIKLRDSGRVNGIVLIKGEERPQNGFSDDSSCPNSGSSLYADDPERRCDAQNDPWNKFGSNLMFESFDFPIFLIKDANESRSIVEYYEKYNSASPSDWPLVSMELTAHMYSSGNTETCIRRSNAFSIFNPQKFCDEMGDFNFFLYLNERNETVERDNSVIVVSTQLDALTLFDAMEFGGDKPATNVVALLETARLLSQANVEFGGSVDNILFAFFYGEAFDNMASTRFVYDMQQGKFPDELDQEKFPSGQQPLMNLSHVDFLVELGQLYNVKSDGRLFAHTDVQFGRSELLSLLKRRGSENNLIIENPSKQVLPPSSLQSVLKEDRSIPGIFLSDFDDSYTNSFFHSIYDTGADNLNYDYELGESQAIVQHIADVAKTLAEFLFEKASTSSTRLPQFNTNATLINELLHCYLDVGNCSLFLAASNENTPPFYSPLPTETPWPQYVGVDMKSQFHGILTRNVLAYLTGETIDDEEAHTKAEDCKTPEGQNIYEYIFLKGESTPSWWTGDKPCNESAECGYCYKTLSFRRQSVSPAFVIDDYDFKDAKYPAWAESVWKSSSARLFLKADPSTQLAYFFVGLAVLIVSFIVVYWLEKYAGEIFVGSTLQPSNGNGGSTSTTTTIAAANADVARSADPPAQL